MKYTISHIILFLCLPFFAFSQEKEHQKKRKDKPKKEEKIRVDRRPTELRVGLDLMSLGTSIFVNQRERFEVNADLDFHDYLFNIDVGLENYEENTPEGNISEYRTNGQYFKVGIDKSLSVENESNSDIFIGFRYARSFYNDELDYFIQDDLWGNGSFSSQNNANARWLEMTFGMKVSMLKNIAIGYTWRMKFAPKVNGSNFDPVFIPGFGSTARNNNVGFNFYLIFKLPVPKRSPKAREE